NNLVDDSLALLYINMFDVDVCCESWDVKINKAMSCILEKENALELDEAWFDRGNTSFCNPPFSRKWEFFNKACEVVERVKKNVLMVLPYTPVTKEWQLH